MGKKEVKGLLDAVEAEAAGDEWTCSPTALGLGLGATDDARRWAELGRLIEAISLFFMGDDEKPRGPGRPRKSDLSTNDVKRAFLLYCAARKLRSEQGLSDDARLEIPLFKLIAGAEEMFPTRDIFKKPAAPNKMYESVKAGREKLQVDEFWRGPPLESLFNLE